MSNITSSLTAPELHQLLQDRKIPTQGTRETTDWRECLVKTLEKSKNQIAVTDRCVGFDTVVQDVEHSNFMITLNDHKNKRTVLLQGWVLK